MLSDCAGSAKHHKFKFVYTMILLIKRWILSCRCSLTLPIAPRQRGTSITFVLVLFLRKRLSGLVARAAYHASGMGRRFAHGRFANTQLPRTCSLTPPSNRLSFTTRSSRRKPRLSRLWFCLLFCWGSLPVVPPLPCRLQRLAATNCLIDAICEINFTERRSARYIVQCITWSFKPVATSIIWTSFAET